MADHLFWWLLRRRNSSAWTWLAYLASVEAASDLVRHPIGTVARTLTRDELAGEMVAWVLEQQNQEETQEMELGKTDGSLAGRLGFQPARASFEAWLHAVALQQARRRVNRRVGLAPEEVGVETGSGWVEGEGDAPGQVPPALRSDERDVPHLLTGLDESQWEAGAGSVTDGYLSAAELGAFRFAATVNWDRTANDGLNTEAFAWSLFGSAQSPDATKRMQAAAARFYLWLLLKDGMTGRVRRQLTEAVEEGWLDEEQAWSETNGLSSYLSNAGARTRHLERGGATYGIHNRLQFAIYNLCAAATLGASDTRDAMRLISGEGRALVEWASKRCGVSTDVLDLARAGDPVRAFGPAGRDHVVTKRSVWDMLRVQRDLTSLASALRVYAAVSENRLWVKGTEALREYAPDRGDVVRLRARLREAHRSHPEVLPSIAAKYWLHDPASAERDRLRRLVTAAHSTPSAAVMLYESATEHSRSTGWHVLDGAPLIKLLLMKEA